VEGHGMPCPCIGQKTKKGLSLLFSAIRPNFYSHKSCTLLINTNFTEIIGCGV
jgi:hypothetical protein